MIGGRGYEECDAGIDGGCGACVKCDPEWWERFTECEFATARLRALGAALAISGRLEAIRRALDYSLADLPTQGRLADGNYTPEVFSRLWRTNMDAWKLARGIR